MDKVNKESAEEKVAAYLNQRFNLRGFQQTYIQESAKLIVDFILERIENEDKEMSFTRPTLPGS